MRIDFSDARYLGMRHGSRELEAWDDLATGFPAAFSEAPEASSVGRAVARLQGLEDGVVAPSTLHFFWDWFGLLHPGLHQVFPDEKLYQVGKWGVERAAGKGVPLVGFAHQSPQSLLVSLEKKLKHSHQPIVVTDGWCPLCGKAAPLKEYIALVEQYNGWLVLDDTQGIGVFGGGGLLPSLKIQSNRVISISSLGKAFGVPLAALTGSFASIAAFRDRSETRVFSSPASASAVHAAQNALKINYLHGDALRHGLLQNVGLFKSRLHEAGISTGGRLFPVQFLKNLDGKAVQYLHGKLMRQGIRSVLSTGHNSQPQICFLLNAGQTTAQLKQACEAIISSIGQCAYGTWNAQQPFTT